MTRQHQSHCTTCPIIKFLKKNYLKKELKILKNDFFFQKKNQNLKFKILDWFWGGEPPHSQMGMAEPHH
jgi:hypothetical protein